MENKRIVILHPHFYFTGGAAVYSIQLANELKRNNFEVMILCLGVGNSFDSSLLHNDIKFINFNSFATSSLLHWIISPYILFKLWINISRFNPDLIICGAFPTHWWAGILKIFRIKAKILWIAHDPNYFIFSQLFAEKLPESIAKKILLTLQPLLRKLDLFLIKRITYFSAITEVVAKTLLDIYKIEFQLLPPGINPVFLSQIEKKVKNKQNSLLCVGRLSKYKNIDLAISVFAELKKNNHDLRLDIIGEGEERRHLMHLSEGMRVYFHGEISDPEKLIKLYEKSMFTLSFSEIESFGLVNIESMACGTPIIISSTGLFSNLISEKEGLILDLSDINECKNIITSTYNDEIKYSFLCKNSKLKAAGYDWNHTVQKLLMLTELDSDNIFNN